MSASQHNATLKISLTQFAGHARHAKCKCVIKISKSGTDFISQVCEVNLHRPKLGKPFFRMQENCEQWLQSKGVQFFVEQFLQNCAEMEWPQWGISEYKKISVQLAGGLEKCN